MTKQDIIDYVMNTPYNTNRAVLNSMLNQLGEGDGGGSSDFSTAEVTVTGTPEAVAEQKSIYLYNILIEDLAQEFFEVDYSKDLPAIIYKNHNVTESDTFTAVLINGIAYATIFFYEADNPPTITTTGDAEVDGIITTEYDYSVVVAITGDCTINIS